MPPRLSATTQHPVAQLNQPPVVAPPPLALTDTDGYGRTQIGKASYYAHKFAGRTMADGRKYTPKGTAAASKTLPLGTIAKVTDLDTDKSALVLVEDRGPYVRGRIIDVSATIAEALEMKDAGVAHVAVKPVAVPHPNGTVTLGSGADELSPGAVARAILMTERLAPTFH
ncbi:MAG TPA: septal ring lytic transglycosylase RlpA family protein [Acetobacteraceae bacterium]